MSHARLYCGDALDVLKTLPAESVQCVVTSPPYWGQRDYGVPGQLGLEDAPQEYVRRVVMVFRHVRRVLRTDGTVWLNLGDKWAAHPNQRSIDDAAGSKQRTNAGAQYAPSRHVDGVKPKDLIGLPWLAAFALRADGWWLRSDIIWKKPNPMPESVTDRPTRAHEYVFLLTKSERYFYDAAAIAEPTTWDVAKSKTPDGWDTSKGKGAHGSIHREGREKGRRYHKESGNKDRDVPQAADGRGIPNDHLGRGIPWKDEGRGRNARSVWTITTQPYPEGHFATFPEELARRCILAGSPRGRCPHCDAPLHGARLEHGKRSATVSPDVSVVQAGVQEREEGLDLLQPCLPGSMGSAESTDDDGPICDSEGLRPDSPAFSSVGFESGLCDGAPARGGEGDRPVSAARRGRAPQEQQERGQPSRESGASAEASTRQASKETDRPRRSALPALHETHLPDWTCDACGREGQWSDAQPTVILDPFGGSGTVAQVATGNGRDSIYIDLNPAYLDLAKQRIGPMLCSEVSCIGSTEEP